jgi:hypothetical protein
MAWSDMRDRMLKSAVAHLNDGTADYQPPGTNPEVTGIDVIVDHNLLQNGADGVFRSNAVGISWRKEQLGSVVRGGVFTHNGASYVVEDTVSDDGHMITVACMVAP